MQYTYIEGFQRLSFSIEALLRTYYKDTMYAETCKDSAEHAIALLSVDPKGIQTHSHSTWLLLKVLLRTLFALMLALSLVLCVVYRHQYKEHNAQNTQIEELFIDQPMGLVFKQHQSSDAVVAPGNVDLNRMQSSQIQHVPRPNSAVFHGISKNGRRKSRTPSRAKMSSFAKILEDLLHEDLLKLHQKILCLDAHADKEVVALKERGFKDVVGINLLPDLLNPKHTHENRQRKKLADQTFDFFFTSMFDRIPNPALFVTEIECAMKVGGLAAMHVSLNKWRNNYITSEPGHGIKPVTLLFQHSEIVYVSSAYASGLDTIIVFKKTTHVKAKQVDQMEMRRKQLYYNPSMPQPIENQVELSTKHKHRKYAEQQPLKSPRYIPKLQGTGSLLYTSMHGTFVPSATHFRGEVVMKKATPIGFPGASNLDTLFIQGLNNVAQLNRAIVQDNFSASTMHGQAGVKDNMAIKS